MRRFFTLAVMLSTAYLLIATSQAPCNSTAETLMLTSRTSCGPETPVTITVDTSCTMTVSDPTGALPAGGRLGYSSASAAAVTRNAYLSSVTDAGVPVNCTLDANAAGDGWTVACTTCTGDAGCDCAGTLSP